MSIVNGHHQMQFKSLILRYMKGKISSVMRRNSERHAREEDPLPSTRTLLSEVQFMCNGNITPETWSLVSAQIDLLLLILEKKNTKGKKIFMDNNAEVYKDEVLLLHKLQAPMDQGEHNTCTSFSIAYCIAHTLYHLYGSDFSITQEQLVSYIMCKCGNWQACSLPFLLRKIKTMICDDDSVWFSTPLYRLRFDINWTVYMTCVEFVKAMVPCMPMPCVVLIHDDKTDDKFQHTLSVWGSDETQLHAHNSWGADDMPSIDVPFHSFLDGAKIALRISHVLNGEGEPMPVPIIHHGSIAVFAKRASDNPLPVLEVSRESAVKRRK